VATGELGPKGIAVDVDGRLILAYDLMTDEAHMGRTLTIDYEEDILLGLGLSADQFSDEARFLLAAKLYELGRLTSGQAARLCGKCRVGFLLSLERIGIPMSNLRPEDAEDELSFARDD